VMTWPTSTSTEKDMMEKRMPSVSTMWPPAGGGGIRLAAGEREGQEEGGLARCAPKNGRRMLGML
jgi:hypothetical protein